MKVFGCEQGNVKFKSDIKRGRMYEREFTKQTF